MPLAAPTPDVLNLVAQVAQAYANLIASPLADPESALGGSLFYAGELDEEGRALVVAANIAGAATLAASAERAAQKQAIRDGIVDFLVTSLDEALRILKNQLRKREAVSICVAMEAAAMEREMNGRGVLPGLLRSAAAGGQGAEANLPALLTWRVASAPAQWLPQLDGIILGSLSADEWPARRWLHLAPRYLGRMAQGIRALACSQEAASRLIAQVRRQVENGEIGVPVAICRRDANGQQENHHFAPVKP